MLYVAIWCVSIRPVVMRVKEGLQFFLHPIVSLGIFSEESDKSMWPGSTQPLKMNTRIFLGLTNLPPSCAECQETWDPEPPGPL